nr:uncharacterized protein LOC109176823 [Ipomoea trifida]
MAADDMSFGSSSARSLGGDVFERSGRENDDEEEDLRVSQIKSAFYSLGKIFSESRIVEYSLTENEISPGKKEILIDNKQYYKFMGRDINMVSLIKLYTDGGKVVRHEDCWDKKPLRNQNTVTLPLVGRMFELSRRASMLATHAMMGFGRDPPNPVM